MMQNRPLFKVLKIGICPLLLLFWLSPQADAASLNALVVGNGDYHESPLKNPVNDAKDIAARLQSLGFEVDLLLNADRRKMKEGIHHFAEKLQGEDQVGLFYYAGHGVEINGENYLIPVSADIRRESDVEYEAINAGRMLASMDLAGNGLNMVILDACRNNPYRGGFRSSSRGLSKMSAPKGALIIYAAQPGEVAEDGAGRNGTFTKHFLQSLKMPGLKVEEVFKETAKAVYRETGEVQLPYIEGVILGDFYFINIQSPAPVQEAKLESGVDIQEMLGICQLHFDSNRLTSPANRNALGCYEDVLKRDPDNRQAVEGLNAIEGRYHGWLKTAMLKGDQVKVERYQSVLLQLNPDTRYIDELDAEQEAARRQTEQEAARKKAEKEAQKVAALKQQQQEQAQKAVALKLKQEKEATLKKQQESQDAAQKQQEKTIEVAKAELLNQITAKEPVDVIDPNNPFKGQWRGTMHCSKHSNGSRAFSRGVRLEIDGKDVVLLGDHPLGNGRQKGKISLKDGIFNKKGKIHISGRAYHEEGWHMEYHYSGLFGEEIILEGIRGSSRLCTFKLSRSSL